MSRPRKTEPRDQQLNLCLTASELESIRKRAEAVGMRPAHWGRSMILKGDTKSNGARKQVTDATANTQRLIYQQLARIGNNLNQLVRHLHQTGEPPPPDLEPLLRDIRQILARRLP